MTDLNEPVEHAVSRRTVLAGALGTAVAATLSTVAATESILSSPALALGPTATKETRP
jgi:hypothetical protein